LPHTSGGATTGSRRARRVRRSRRPSAPDGTRASAGNRHRRAGCAAVLLLPHAAGAAHFPRRARGRGRPGGGPRRPLGRHQRGAVARGVRHHVAGVRPLGHSGAHADADCRRKGGHHEGGRADGDDDAARGGGCRVGSPRPGAAGAPRRRTQHSSAARLRSCMRSCAAKSLAARLRRCRCWLRRRSSRWRLAALWSWGLRARISGSTRPLPCSCAACGRRAHGRSAPTRLRTSRCAALQLCQPDAARQR
jgi:hypothetical protein